jgi:hypothetical protein
LTLKQETAGMMSMLAVSSLSPKTTSLTALLVYSTPPVNRDYIKRCEK